MKDAGLVFFLIFAGLILLGVVDIFIFAIRHPNDRKAIHRRNMKRLGQLTLVFYLVFAILIFAVIGNALLPLLQ